MKKIIQISQNNYSRRSFIKFLGLSAVSLYGCQRIKYETSLANGIPTSVTTPTELIMPTATSSASDTPQSTLSSTATPARANKFVFDDIDFSDPQNLVSMKYFMDDRMVQIEGFIPLKWRPDIESSGDFDPNKNTGVTYLDNQDRLILNVHSGRSRTKEYTMWPMQQYFEEDEQGKLLSSAEVNKKLIGCIGSRVQMQQNATISDCEITGVVRIPPYDLEEYLLEADVMYIVEWIAEKYPYSQFSKLLNESYMVIDKFCGRCMPDETPVKMVDNARIPEYQQTRFFIAKQPINI